MLHLFLNPSPLLVAGEFLVGMSLPMFVAALIAVFGDRIRLTSGDRGRLGSIGAQHPRHDRRLKGLAGTG